MKLSQNRESALHDLRKSGRNPADLLLRRLTEKLENSSDPDWINEVEASIRPFLYGGREYYHTSTTGRSDSPYCVDHIDELR